MLDKLSVHTPIQWQSLWLSQKQELASDIITAKLVLQRNLSTATQFTRNEYFVGWKKQKNLGVIIFDMTDQGVNSLDWWHKSQWYLVFYPNLVSFDLLSIQKPRQSREPSDKAWASCINGPARHTWLQASWREKCEIHISRKTNLK